MMLKGRKPKVEIIVTVILSVIFLILAILIFRGDFSFYLKDGTPASDSSKYGFLLSALIQSLSAILAIVFALTIFAVQMSAHSYSTRVINLHTASPIFIIPFMIFLIAIIYLVISLGKFQSEVESEFLFSPDLAILLSVFALSLLIPFVYRTINLLKPKRLMKVLMERIKPADFSHYKDKEYRIKAKIQPIFDIIMSAIRKFDQETAIEGLKIIDRRCKQIIHFQSNERIVQGIVSISGQYLKDLCLYSSQFDNVTISKEVLNTISEITSCIMRGTARKPILGFLEVLNELENNIGKRFSDELYQEQLHEIKEKIADCRMELADVL